MDNLITNAAAVILCGGKSSRMGFDKALMEWNGRPLIDKTISLLKEVFAEVVLVCDQKEKFDQIALPAETKIIEDHYLEIGPLGGICSAFEELSQPWLFVTACDIPFIDTGLILKMYQSLESNQIVLCRHDDHLEPLFAFYHRSCLAVFQQQIKAGQFQLRREFERFTTEVINGDDLDLAFANLNTTDDIRYWKGQDK